MYVFIKSVAGIAAVLMALWAWYQYTKKSKLLTADDVLDVLSAQTSCGYNVPILEPVSGLKDTWMLVEDWTFKSIFIPRFFFCDLDSIPRIPYIYSYLKGYARVSALTHDWHYATALLSRKEADRVFYDIMILEGVHRYRAKIIYVAVRAAGWLFYDKKEGVRDALMAPEVRNVVYT